MEKESWAEERAMKSERSGETKIAETGTREETVPVPWEETRAGESMSGEAMPWDEAGMRKRPMSCTKT